MIKSVLETETHFQFFAKKNAPTLIFLHGWLQTWESWSPIVSELSKKYQLVLVDLPGFGTSTFTNPDTDAWNSDDYAQWLAAFIDSLGIPKTQPLFIAGHSFGGKIAAVCAATYAKTTTPSISGIILVSASGISDALSVQTQLKQSIISLIPQPVKQLLPNTLKSKVLSTLTVSTDHLQSSAIQRKILKRIVRENISATLNKINIPTQLIWGNLDTTTPLHQGYAFHVALRNSKLVLCKKSGHFPFIDEPNCFIENVQEFIEQIKHS